MIDGSIGPTTLGNMLLLPVEYFRYLGVVPVGYIVALTVSFWLFLFSILYFREPTKALSKILNYSYTTCILGISYIVLIGTLRSEDINAIFHSIAIVVFLSTIFILSAKVLKYRGEKLLVAYNKGEFNWN
jgi:hypothetical protein